MEGALYETIHEPWYAQWGMKDFVVEPLLGSPKIFSKYAFYYLLHG